MKSFSTRLLAVLLTLVMLIGMLPATALAAGEKMTISASTVSALAGSTVTVKIELKDNPGVSSIQLDITYDDSVLDLTAIEYNAAMGGQSLPPQNLVSPATLTWVSPFANFNGDTTFATLTFKIADNAAEDSVYPIAISYDPNNIYNMDENNIPCNVIDGCVKVLSCVPGDINGDRVVNNKDVTRMFQYIAKWDVEVNEPTLDTNGDGYVNNKDLTRLFQYIAKWDVELHCGSVTTTKCNHELIAFEAEPATCTENGHVAYWQCSLCNKYFTSADAVAETTVDKLAIEATGHTAVIDPAVEPTYDSVGYTEGSHCSVCNTVIVPQTEIPMLTKAEYAITYHVANNDTYLAGLNIENPNAATYTTEDGIWLEDLMVPGYVFEGWYDGAGSNGSLVKEIAAGSKGNRTLYAKWTKTEYTVQFESDLIPVDDVTYTVDQGRVLPVPELSGYTFVGWSDEEGKVLKKIPAGETGTKTYKANWLSDRNQAWAYKEVSEPMILEEDGKLLLVYEIGEIRNVPIQVIQDFGKINSDGVEKTVTKTYKISTSKTEMENYTDTVSKATTESFGWTLAKEWSDSISVNEEWAQEQGMTVEEVEEVCTNESSNWYVSSGSSGTDTTETIESTDTSVLQTTTKNNKNYNSSSSETRQDYSTEATVESKISSEVSATVKAPGVGEASSSVSAEVSAGMTAKEEVGYTSSSTSGSESESGSSSETGKVATSGTNTTNSSSWNSESGCGGSSSVTNTSSVSKAIAETISQKTGYGKEYIQSENNEETMDTSSSTENSKEYSAGVSYSVEESEEITETFTTSNTKSGYHRWVIAGTAHVFAVVGYDIATDSYFTTTYSVMDDKTHQFEDYSYSYASYDDNQNSVIPFEIPDDIEYYVHERTGKSEGLEVSASGVITGYEGTDEMVIIPEYARVENLDGTSSVIKVTGISANAFRGNTSIKAVLMSDFITEIPSIVDNYGEVRGAFEGCTSLVYVEGKGISSVGENAFKNCPSLNNCELGENVISLGSNAFEGAESFVIKASSAAVVEAALASGAKNIVIGVGDSCKDLNNKTLTVPATVETFTFFGYGKTFDNLIIESNATAQTNIYRATLNSAGKTPLKIASAKVTMQEVTATAPGIALMLLADSTALVLYGESFMTSEGENAVLSKDVILSQYKSGYYSHITATGKYLLCGEIKNDSYLTVVANSEQKIVPITSTMFDKYAAGAFKIIFDANGGDVSVSERQSFYGTAIGELPEPTRDYYTFDGWYTAKEYGEKVTADTAFEVVENITLYAMWTLNETSEWVLASELPADAQIVNTKWTYDLTTNITSDVAEVEGYELYNTTSAWGEYGAWTAWSKTAATASDSVQVEQKTVTDKAAYNQYRYIRYANTAENRIHWCPTLGNKYYPGTWTKQTTEWSTTRKDKFDTAYGTCSCHGSVNRYGTTNQTYYYEEVRTIAAVTHQEYRYRVRELIYTYYLTKTEAMESETEITATENVSNVYKWVQYRAK